MAHILILTGATGGTMSVDMQSLYKHVAWCAWHEGLRLYDNGVPGQLKDLSFLRSSCLKLQQHHEAAGALISAASDSELTAVMSQIESVSIVNITWPGISGGWHTMRPGTRNCRTFWQRENIMKSGRFITGTTITTATPDSFYHASVTVIWRI